MLPPLSDVGVVTKLSVWRAALLGNKSATVDASSLRLGGRFHCTPLAQIWRNQFSLAGILAKSGRGNVVQEARIPLTNHVNQVLLC